ncbi:hypothetical protein IGI04_019428 [Brassica rapa subsp. trilocularis]|uniref:RGS domain-containing protein n=1 Tax=Brassica rapa subsp. trilocularis TaxID=1813537 RepID=A0ABQ7MFT7_BRACM|nr:hypothetical protein IGI04_019428 [Brassica rapa subsp. trilocularis]
MPNSTRSNKETQLLFSPDPASLEPSIRKEARSSSIDNNTCSSLDFRQPPSTQALVPSTDTRSPPSTKDTHLPSTDIFHPISIDTSEGHLRNAASQRTYAQGASIPESDTDATCTTLLEHKQKESIYYIYKIMSDLEISDDFGAFWRYLEQAPDMTIELDHRSILREKYISMFTSEHRSTAKRAENPFCHNRLEAQVFTNLQDYPDEF